MKGLKKTLTNLEISISKTLFSAIFVFCEYHIFFRCCVPEMFVTPYSVTYCIYIPGKPGFCFRYYYAVYDEFKYHSFVCTEHHLIIIIVQTYLKTLNLWNACQIYFVECVNEIKHILSVIYHTIYGAVCFQFANLPCDDWDDIYFVLLSSSNRKYGLLPIV